MTRNTWRLLAAGAAALLTVGSIFIPVDVLRSDVRWSPLTAEDNGALHLTSGVPEAMTIAVQCDGVRAAQPFVVVGGPWSVAVDPNSATLELPESVRINLPLTQSDPCARFTVDASKLTVTSQSSAGTSVTDIAMVNLPVIDRLVMDPVQPQVVSVTLTTLPTGIAPDLLPQLLLLVGLVTALVVLIDLVWQWRSQRVATATKVRGARRVTGPDVLVVAVALVSVFLVPAYLDDGWVLGGWGANRDEGGFLSQYYDYSDSRLPTGYPYAALLHALTSSGIAFVWIRIAIALVLIVTWLVIQRGIVARMDLGRPGSWAAATVFAIFIPAWLMTVRFELPIVLCVAVAIAGLLAFARNHSVAGLTAFGLAAAVACSLHQVGLAAALPVLMVVPTLWRWIRQDRRNGEAALTIALASATLWMAMMFGEGGVPLVAKASRELAGYSAFTYSLGAEVDRYVFLLNAGDLQLYGSSVRWFSLIIVALCLGLALLTRATWNDQARHAIAMALIVPVSLLATFTKWPWHLSVLAVPAAVFAAAAGSFIATELQRGRRATPGVVLGIVVAGAGICLAFPGSWGAWDLVVTTWTQFADRLGAGPRNTLAWIAAVVVAVALPTILVRLFGTRRSGPVIAAIMVIGVLLPTALGLTWIARDAAASPTWSFPKQTVQEILGQQECGLLSEVQVTIGATALAPSQGLTGSTGTPMAEGAWLQVPNLFQSPLADLPVLGTRVAVTEGANPDDATGEFVSGLYDIGDARSLVLWTGTLSWDSVAGSLAFYDSSGTQIDDVPLRFAKRQVWLLNTVPVPAGAVAAQILTEDRKEGYGGWAAVTAPAVAQAVPFAELPDVTTHIGPFKTMAVPCIKLPGNATGVAETVNYTVGMPSWNYAWVRPFATLTQVACTDVPGACVYQVRYPQANVSISQVASR